MRVSTLVLSAAVLAACRATTSAPPWPSNGITVRLDHAYVVLDSATHATIASDSFLATELAAVQQRSTATADGRRWTGLYVQGRLTYLELFTPGRFGDIGASGIGFNVAASGEIEELRSRFHAAFGDSGSVELITGIREGQPQPWYYSLHPPSASTGVLNQWIMEYHPSFLQWQQIDSVAPDGRHVRRLSPRRAYNGDRLVKDVVGVRLALPDRERRHLVQELGRFGWRIRTAGDTSHAVGPDVRLSLEPVVQGRAGIREFTLSLRRAVAVRRLLLGTTSLIVRDTVATWTIW